MAKPKFRITLTMAKLYKLAEQRHIDFESDTTIIRLCIADNYSFDVVDMTQELMNRKVPPNQVN